MFDDLQYAWPLLAGLLWVAAQSGGRLNVQDFGGSLGSTYFQNYAFLSRLAQVRWNIVEQPRHVEMGREWFEDDYLKMDIEGAEIDALRGSKETLKTFKPKLTIAVYHELDNAKLARQIVLAARPDYDVMFSGIYAWDGCIPRPYMLLGQSKGVNRTE